MRTFIALGLLAVALLTGCAHRPKLPPAPLAAG